MTTCHRFIILYFYYMYRRNSAISHTHAVMFIIYTNYKIHRRKPTKTTHSNAWAIIIAIVAHIEFIFNGWQTNEKYNINIYICIWNNIRIFFFNVYIFFLYIWILKQLRIWSVVYDNCTRAECSASHGKDVEPVDMETTKVDFDLNCDSESRQIA